MSKKNDPTLKPTASKLTLEDVKKLFEKWRRKKQQNGLIPEELWQAAVNLTKEYPISTVSGILSLDHPRFKDRVLASKTAEESNTATPSFIELDFAKPSIETEYIIEMENKNGNKMKFCIKGEKVDVLELMTTFWSQNS